MLLLRAQTQHDFSQGSFQTTGDGRDLAIEGSGFFVVQRGEDQLYTRAGAFRQDAAGNLVTIDGDTVLGYAIDDDYNVIDGVLVNGSAKLVGWFAGVARKFQSGFVYHYAFTMIIGVFVLLTWWFLRI